MTDLSEMTKVPRVNAAIDSDRQELLAKLEALRPKYEQARRESDRASSRSMRLYNEILAANRELAKLAEAEKVLGSP